MNRKYLENNRGKIYYWISENPKDKAIVFCHGLTADHTLYDKQIEYFEKENTVITWDMPLHGETRPYLNFSLENAVYDLKQILERENILHVVIVGQSGGGYVAQLFAYKYPKMTDALIAIDSNPMEMNYYKKSELFWTNHFYAIASLYPYSYYCKVSAESAAYTQESQNSFYKCLVRLGKKGMLTAAGSYYKDFPNYDNIIISCPVLLVLGEFDKIGFVKRYNEMWAEKTKYKLLVIPKASHNSNYDNYEYFNQVVMEFLQECKQKKNG